MDCLPARDRRAVWRCRWCALTDFMQRRESASVAEFMNYVWQTRGATDGTIKTAIHRFNSQVNARFQLSLSAGKVTKVK
jgi:hypothetical protein